MRTVLSGGAVLLALVVGATGAALAKNTLRWSSQGDALTMDPHAQNEGPTNTMGQQIYEPLINRDPKLALVPSLATEWKAIEPTVWEFKLRTGVKFHDGASFDAEDVVFSIERARSETSDFKGYLTSVTEVHATDAGTVRIVTGKGPNPILPNQLTEIHIVDKGWAEKHGVTKPQNFKGGEETFAVRNANGTGPFKLVRREPDVRTVLEKNPNWWGLAQEPHNVDEVVYTPVKNDATRVAALLSGELDFVLDPPLQDIERLSKTPGLKILQTPQIRTIFLGMDQARPELRASNVKGKNPFADKRVREAVHRAIDIEAIKTKVMRGLAAPAGIITAPGVHGYTPELDQRLPFDPAKAKALLAEAGYPDGFEVTLSCPNDRYINDEAICQAITGMLGRVGIKINLRSQTKTIHFKELQNKEQDFYMLGWGVPTLDSHYVFNFLYKTGGGWNHTGYSNPRVDELTAAMERTIDLAERDRLIAEAWKIVKEDMVYVPLHHQVITWALRDTIEMPIEPNDSPQFAWARFKR